MTEIEVKTVDVYVVRQSSSGLDILVMRRAPGVRCTGAWEVVHGRIEPGEKPEQAARREVVEETGFTVERLYNVTCLPFYLPKQDTVNMAVVLAAFVAAQGDVRLGEEHDASEWLPAAQGAERIAWPRAREMIRDILQLVGSGNAGPLEDVLLVR